MCDYTDDFEENVNDEDVEKPEDFSGKNSYECLESDETYKGGLEKQNLDICDDMQESLEDINDYLENCEEVDLDSEIELEIDDIEMANLEEIQDILPDLDENLEKDQLDFSNKEKISKIDCDKLIQNDMGNIEDILDVCRDDMLDKRLSGEEIEEKLQDERGDLEEFWENSSLDKEDNMLEENVDGNDELIESYDEYDENQNGNSIDKEKIEFRENILNKDLQVEECLEEPKENKDFELNFEEIVEKTQLNNLESDKNDLKTETELTDKENADIMRDFVEENVSQSMLPKTGGMWVDPEKVGNSEWILDDEKEIKWQKDGELHTITGHDLKEKYNLEGVFYNNNEPDFEPFEDDWIGHVEVENFSDHRGGKDGTYSVSIQQAANELGSSKDDIEEYMNREGLTWHECGDRKTIRAIPTEINAAFKHTGGIGIEKSLRAVADELDEKYGSLKLEHLEMEGKTNTDELENALNYQRKMYRNHKK